MKIKSKKKPTKKKAAAAVPKKPKEAEVKQATLASLNCIRCITETPHKLVAHQDPMKEYYRCTLCSCRFYLTRCLTELSYPLTDMLCRGSCFGPRPHRHLPSKKPREKIYACAICGKRSNRYRNLQ